MPSEALRNVRTMRQVKTSLDIARHQKPRTTSSLFRTGEEAAHLQSLTDGQVGQILSKENKRFAAMAASIDKSRQRLLRAREKLATTINKNRALNQLRHELQQARSSEGRNPIPAETQTEAQTQVKAKSQAKVKVPARKPKTRQVKLKY
jgi:hypothetical protein